MSLSGLIFVFSLSIALVWFKISSRKHMPFPPDPPGDPLIGHLQILPSDNHDSFFYGLGKKYGDVVYLNILGRSMIILSSVQVAIDLLEKRSSNYSDRPSSLSLRR